jgi:hypothetical protein
VASAARDEPVEATASQVARWLLVEVEGPWGRDAIRDSQFGPFAPAVWRQAMKRHGIRVITIRRDLAHHHHGGAASGFRLVFVQAPRPGSIDAAAFRVVVPDLHAVVDATSSLADGHGPDRSWSPDPDRYVLVCTNGRHDACCATYGRPVVRALRESPWRDEVWECSHIGGDRWAANIVILPDSLYYGRQDATTAAGVLAAHEEGRLDLTGFRGRSTLRLPEQAAEQHLRTALGLDRIDAVRSLTRVDEETVRVELMTAEGPATYDVVVRRDDVPSPTPLTCKGRDGQHYPSFTVEAMTPV